MIKIEKRNEVDVDAELSRRNRDEQCGSWTTLSYTRRDHQQVNFMPIPFVIDELCASMHHSPRIISLLDCFCCCWSVLVFAVGKQKWPTNRPIEYWMLTIHKYIYVCMRRSGNVLVLVYWSQIANDEEFQLRGKMPSQQFCCFLHVLKFLFILSFLVVFWFCFMFLFFFNFFHILLLSSIFLQWN